MQDTILNYCYHKWKIEEWCWQIWSRK